jgi:hypothetical protein
MVREYQADDFGSVSLSPSSSDRVPGTAAPGWDTGVLPYPAILPGAMHSASSRVSSPVLQLQRRHGNRFVQRAFALANQWVVQRQDSGDGDGTPGLPGPLGQTITCSVDPIKIAAALGGDRSAALYIVNCCESGFSPLPSGCSKDLVDALKKILGQKPGAPNRCPPGFHPGKSTLFQGQCCSDGANVESAQNCCPGERASMMGFCCPPGQTAQGLGCTSPAATPAMPEPSPSEPGDYEVPDENSNVAVA